MRWLVFTLISWVTLACSGPSSPQVQEVKSNGGLGVGRFAQYEIPAFDSVQANAGEPIFVRQCGTCHDLGNERRMGPGLKGITGKRKPQWILNMVVNASEMLEKDPDAFALTSEYASRMVPVQLSDDEAIGVLQYLRKNDFSH